jgi:hypothetical protein
LFRGRCETSGVLDNDWKYASAVAYYIFHLTDIDTMDLRPLGERANDFLRAGMWGIDIDDRHREALGEGDVALMYLGAPVRQFVARAEVASRAHEWTPVEARRYPGDSLGGVLLSQVEGWDPPVAMSAVLPQIDPAENAKADFGAGVVRITSGEFETAIEVAAGVADSRS